MGIGLGILLLVLGLILLFAVKEFPDSLQEVVERVCTQPEVRCVSFRQLVDWLDAQDPQVLEKLRTLKVGRAPKQGWESFLEASPAPAPRGVPGAPPAKR